MLHLYRWFYLSMISAIVVKSSATKLESLTIKCRQKYQLTAKYVVSTDSKLSEEMYHVATCRPSEENSYCHQDNAVWINQSCKLRKIDEGKYSIKCKVTNPFDGPLKDFQTFGLRITVLSTSQSPKMVQLKPITPSMICMDVTEFKLVVKF